ncbi:MAG: glycosyltransferase [Chloroflexales bacterium]|nr:glycosyltransferase [Chloroflexales bacterium]
MSQIVYIAYPNSLNLRSANAIQTFSTLRELKRLRPDLLALIPRRDRTPSRFGEIGATHLLSTPVGKLSRLHRSTLWYYAERSLFALECFVLLWARGWRGGVVYVREAICAAWWAGLFGPLLGARVVYEAHDLESRNPSRAKERWAEGLLHLIDRVALTRAAAVVSLTDDFRRYLTSVGWRDATEVFVVPDAYDPTLFAPQDRAACRAALDLPADAELIAYTGMTFAYRWLEGLLEAGAQLVPQRPRLMLALVGGRPHEVAELRTLATRLGIAERVLLTGQLGQREVLRYSGAADVLAIPDTITDVTASPLKLFEYLALGQPVVLPDIPSLREIVPPQLGHYFERRNLPALSAALASALDQPGDAAARQALAADHTYARRAERIVAVLERMKDEG